MKNKISLIALMSVMLSLSQPAWSMEDNKRKRDEDEKSGITPATSGRRSKQPKIENKEEEPKNSSLTFTDLFPELREYIFSFLAASKRDGVAPELLALSSVSHQIRDEVTYPPFLRSCLRVAAPHIWAGEDKDWNQPLFLFHILKKNYLDTYVKDFGDGCRLFKSPLAESKSPLLAYRLALTDDSDDFSDDDKKLKEKKVSEAINSLLSEISPEDKFENGFPDSKKDASFLLLYFMNPNKDQRVENRLQDAKAAVLEDREEKETVPHHLLRIMSVRDRSLSREDKMKFFKELVKRNDIVGEFNFCMALLWDGVITDSYKKTLQLLGEIAERGLAEAQNDHGLNCLGEKRVTYLEKAAQQGLPEAHENLGQYYAHLDTPDYFKAVHWWKKAAQQDCGAVVTYNLALAYEEGKGVTQDIAQASFWYQYSLGAEAIFEPYNALAILYETGRGVSQDLDKARKLYEKGVDLGDDYAEENLKTIGQNAPRLKHDFLTDPLQISIPILTSEVYGNLGNFFP
ncbi:MAG TPA: tetratricopeptide repeat protein [Alphaproteobacteria bacterium]|nr:tetratricopeptide repeat protein [Alphaproteobacteria bacterium]